MRKKKELERFARFCFGVLELPPIRIHYCPSKSLVDPFGNYCFGCYTFGVSKSLYTKNIWLAYKLPKFAIMWNLAHEIWHYKQDRDGRIHSMKDEACEEEADKAAMEMVADWRIRGGKVVLDIEKAD